MLIDTHCHVHDSDYSLDPDDTVRRAFDVGVRQMICVGTSVADSRQALEFAANRDGIFASVGVHPHYAKDNITSIESLIDSVYLGNGFVPGPNGASSPVSTRAADVSVNKGVRSASRFAHERKLVAIGEIGLDYFYKNSTRKDQINLLQQQVELALKHDLPIIFHVRDAFDDFWPIFDGFHGIRGVLHCFTDTMENAKKGLERGLYFGLNGISTFTKDDCQKEMFKTLPIDKIMFETDAPALTPHPLRGKVKENEPAYIKQIAEYNAQVREISLTEISNATTMNARALFKL